MVYILGNLAAGTKGFFPPDILSMAGAQSQGTSLILRCVTYIATLGAIYLVFIRTYRRPRQDAGDVLTANDVLMDTDNTDVRPPLAEVRAELGVDPDPMAAYRRSGYAERIAAERVGGTQAGWGA